MNVQYKAIRRRVHVRWSQTLAALLSLVMLLSSQPFLPATVTPALAQTNTMTLAVQDAVSGAPISTFNYIINVDNTGTTEQRGPNDPLHQLLAGGACLRASSQSRFYPRGGPGRRPPHLHSGAVGLWKA